MPKKSDSQPFSVSNRLVPGVLSVSAAPSFSARTRLPCALGATGRHTRFANPPRLSPGTACCGKAAAHQASQKRFSTGWTYMFLSIC